MPWHVEKRGREWCVIKDADGSSAGCHITQIEAESQVRALYAYESGMAANGDGPDTVELGMVALYLRPDEAETLAVEGGLAVSDLHLTLVFLGIASNFDSEKVTAAVGEVAAVHGPLEGVVGGTGQFGEMEDGIPAILLPDVVGLSRLREDIMATLRAKDIGSPSTHGFLPHITQIYHESFDDVGRRPAFIGQELHFDSVSVVVGDRRQDYPLGTPRPSADQYGRQPSDELGLRSMLTLPTTALARALPTSELRKLTARSAPTLRLDVGLEERVSDEQRELVTLLASRAGDLGALTTALEALAIAVARPQSIPVVHVHVPEQEFAPVVNVQVPESPAPVVHLAETPAPVVHVDVHVPEQAPPIVNVEVPELPLRRIEFERGPRGLIEAAEEVVA